MTKAEIVQAVYDRLGGFSKKEAAELVDLVFELMKETLGHGEKIKVSGFGNFVLRDKRKRQGRNPQTGEPIEITERRVLNFKASQILKQVLNQDRPPARPVGEGATSGNGAGHGALPAHANQAHAGNGNGFGDSLARTSIGAAGSVPASHGGNGASQGPSSAVVSTGMSAGGAQQGATHMAAAGSGHSNGRMS